MGVGNLVFLSFYRCCSSRIGLVDTIFALAFLIWSPEGVVDCSAIFCFFFADNFNKI